MNPSDSAQHTKVQSDGLSLNRPRTAVEHDGKGAYVGDT